MQAAQQLISELLNKTNKSEEILHTKEPEKETVKKVESTKKIKKEKGKKPKKYSSPEDPTYKIVSISVPEEVKDDPKGKSQVRFRVQIGWKSDKANGKRIIGFGKKGVMEYIDHGDKTQRDKVIKSLKNYDSPFKPNFYKLFLLNGESKEIFTNYMTVLNKTLKS
jgi:hypothetical protein